LLLLSNVEINKKILHWVVFLNKTNSEVGEVYPGVLDVEQLEKNLKQTLYAAGDERKKMIRHALADFFSF
jgi:hypothetical protein